MASQFAPETFEIIDLGTAPEIYVDGLALYREEQGIIRSVFYANQPDLTGGAEPIDVRMTRVVALKLLYTPQAQERMRRHLIEHMSSTRDPFKLELTRLRS